MDLSSSVDGHTHETCGTCRHRKPLVGQTEARLGCLIALYAWYWRNVPDELWDAERVDVVKLARRGETTREWIEVATWQTEDSQACGFWRPVR